MTTTTDDIIEGLDVSRETKQAIKDEVENLKEAMYRVPNRKLVRAARYRRGKRQPTRSRIRRGHSGLRPARFAGLRRHLGLDEE